MITRKLIQLVLISIVSSFIPISFATHHYPEKSVEILELSVPEVAKEGDNVNLTCRFAIRDEALKIYSINWWRGKEQFYSYKKNNYQPKNAYAIKGIKVNLAASNAQVVALEKITEQTSGEYKCEVMTEGPAFKTDVDSKTMKVIVPPKDIVLAFGPAHEPNHQYRIGDLVQLNCTAMGAKPRPLILWKINNREVPQTYVERFPDYENHKGRVTATLQLRFRADRLFFNERQARVTCVVDVEGEMFEAEKIIRLHPSAVFDLYSSSSCDWSITWEILGILSIVAYIWNL